MLTSKVKRATSLITSLLVYLMSKKQEMKYIVSNLFKYHMKRHYK